VPTEIGLAVYRQRKRFFPSPENQDTVKQRPTHRPFAPGGCLDDVVPKEIAYRLIEPALRLEMPVRLVCHEANLERLVAELALHEIDVVLSDSPVTPSLKHARLQSLPGRLRRRGDGAATLGEALPQGFRNR